MPHSLAHYYSIPRGAGTWNPWRGVLPPAAAGSYNGRSPGVAKKEAGGIAMAIKPEKLQWEFRRGDPAIGAAAADRFSRVSPEAS